MAMIQETQIWTVCYINMPDKSLNQKIPDSIQCVDAPKNTLLKIIKNIRKIYPQQPQT